MIGEYTTILVRVARYGKDYYLKVEAQGGYKSIGGVAREFTLKLKKGENLVGRDSESGLREYFGINDKELTHYYKKKAGKVDYQNPIINEDNYSFISLTNNRNMLMFNYNVGLKISEGGKLIWFLWNLKRIQGFNFEVVRQGLEYKFGLEPKGKSISTIIKGGEKYLVDSKWGRRYEVFIDSKENEKDLFLFIGQHYGNTYFIGYRLQPHYKYSHNRYMIDLDETEFEVLSEGDFIGEYTPPKEVLKEYTLN